MLRKIALTCFAVTGLFLAGCGGGDDTGTTDVDMAMAVFKVVSGPYAVSSVTKVSDGCQLGLESGFTSIQVTNNGQGHLSLGTQCMSSGALPNCNPAVFSNGEGDFTDSFHVTTTATTVVSADAPAGCTYTRTRTNVVTVTANNSLHVEFTEDESNINQTACGFNMATCQSKYTFNATM